MKLNSVRKQVRQTPDIDYRFAHVVDAALAPVHYRCIEISFPIKRVLRDEA